MGWNFYNTSYYPISELLKAGPGDRNALTVQWTKGKTAELQFVGLTVRRRPSIKLVSDVDYEKGRAGCRGRICWILMASIRNSAGHL